MTSFSDLYLSARFSDVALRGCDSDLILAAHRIVLRRCKVLDDMLSVPVVSASPMKPGIETTAPSSLPHIVVGVSKKNLMTMLSVLYELNMPHLTVAEAITYRRETEMFGVPPVGFKKGNTDICDMLGEPTEAEAASLSLADLEVVLRTYMEAELHSKDRISIIGESPMLPRPYVIAYLRLASTEGAKMTEKCVCYALQNMPCVQGDTRMVILVFGWARAVLSGALGVQVSPEVLRSREEMVLRVLRYLHHLVEYCDILLDQDVEEYPVLSRFVLREVRLAVAKGVVFSLERRKNVRKAEVHSNPEAEVDEDDEGAPQKPVRYCQYVGLDATGLPKPCRAQTNGQVRCGERRCQSHEDVDEEDPGYLAPCRCGSHRLTTVRVGQAYFCRGCSEEERRRMRLDVVAEPTKTPLMPLAEREGVEGIVEEDGEAVLSPRLMAKVWGLKKASAKKPTLLNKLMSASRVQEGNEAVAEILALADKAPPRCPEGHIGCQAKKGERGHKKPAAQRKAPKQDPEEYQDVCCDAGINGCDARGPLPHPTHALPVRVRKPTAKPQPRGSPSQGGVARAIQATRTAPDAPKSPIRDDEEDNELFSDEGEE
jgi:hypothetical protein